MPSSRPRLQYSPEREAARLLQKLGIIEPPIDVMGIARSLGFVLVESEDLDAEVSAMLIYGDKGKSPLVVVRKSDTTKRKRFSIGHEIGHHLLHAQRPLLIEPMTPKFRLRERRLGGELASPREESQANRFSAELLMPEEQVMFLFDQLGAHKHPNRFLDNLAKKFQVSREAMQYRLLNVGLLATLGEELNVRAKAPH